MTRASRRPPARGPIHGRRLPPRGGERSAGDVGSPGPEAQAISNLVTRRPLLAVSEDADRASRRASRGSRRSTWNAREGCCCGLHTGDRSLRAGAATAAIVAPTPGEPILAAAQLHPRITDAAVRAGSPEGSTWNPRPDGWAEIRHVAGRDGDVARGRRPGQRKASDAMGAPRIGL
jgi:hypothetical protein